MLPITANAKDPLARKSAATARGLAASKDDASIKSPVTSAMPLPKET